MNGVSMKIFVFASFIAFNIALSCKAMGPFYDAMPRSTATPCPFINTVLKSMSVEKIFEPDAREISSKLLVDFSVQKYGVDRSLMETLAQGRADDMGNIVICDLLNPDQFPAHRGSLARTDSATRIEFSKVDDERLEVLLKDKRFHVKLESYLETKYYISYQQLKDYQRNYCWAASDMGCMEKIPAKAELHLLWALFGAYRIKLDSDGVDLIPLDLVYNFLRDSSIPDNFKPNTTDPATKWSVACCILTE